MTNDSQDHLKLNLIVAMGNSRQIGKDNKLLWHISEDLKNFKKLTSGKTLLMGRKTFDSIGRVLPGRTTIVLTRDPDWKKDQVHVVHSMQEALEKARQLGAEEIQVVGGGHVYQEVLPYVEKIYLSLVDYSGDADTFFPDYEKYSFQEINRVHYPAMKNCLAWDFIELERRL